MKYCIVLFIIAASLSIHSCAGDEEEPAKSVSALKINEYMPRGSEFTNELGNAEDWFEIYNSSDSAFALEAGKHFFSDDPNDPVKYVLPKDTTIPGKGYVIIWCDAEDRFINEIHTNFKLSGAGESILISARISLVDIEILDLLSYKNALDGFSYGRLPDGSDVWDLFSHPTPGSANLVQ